MPVALIRVVEPPKLQRDWPKHRVRAHRDIFTSVAMIPEGRLGTVTSATHGIAIITFDPCDCCLVRPRLRWKSYAQPGLVSFVEEVANG